MREIKFRVWVSSKSKMIKLNPYNLPKTGPRGLLSDLVEDENWKVMQYTGLKDKNGKEIYEGDVIKGKFRDGKILFKNGGFYCWDEHLDESLSEDECEVIGNVWENPELLEKEKNEKI